MDGFPLGPAALHPDWLAARFNVSGLFIYDSVLAGYMTAVWQAFGIRGPVESIHGAPDSRWNGGRVAAFASTSDKYEPSMVAFMQNNLGCFLTFTNHLLDEADLSDPMCNSLLDLVARRPDINGVIVASELLSRYIAQKYPSLPQVASITKVAVENGRGSAAYYNELSSRFYRYVVHPDDCLDLRLLDQLDRNKAEIIVNENCLRGCTVRPRHYHLIAKAQQASARARANASGSPGPIPVPPEVKEVDQFTEVCRSLPITKQLQTHELNCNFTFGHFKQVYDLGFRHFKLQGRRDHLFSYVYDLVRYTLEPDVAAPLIFKAMCSAMKFNVASAANG